MPIRHGTQITGTNNPAKQVSKDAWNAPLVGFSPDVMDDFDAVVDAVASTLTETTSPLTLTTADNSGAAADRLFPVKAVGDGNPQLQINSEGWGKYGLMRSGDTVDLRLTSSSTPEEEYVATLLIDGVADADCPTFSVTTEATVLPPDAPVITGSYSDTSYTISWSSVAGATSYKVYRKTLGGSYSLVDTVYDPTVSSTAAKTSGTGYYWKVVANNASGDSADSNEVTNIQVYDTCTDTTNTALTSHTPEVGTWTAEAGTMKINGSNKIVWNSSASGFAVSRVASAGADGVIQSVFSGTGGGVIANVVSGSSGNQCWMGWNAGGSFTLYERNSGTFTNRASQAGETTAPGLRTAGDTIYLLKAGTSVGSYTGSPRNYKTAAAFGVMIETSATAQIDDVLGVL